MTAYSNPLLKRGRREEGFTLVEIMFAIVILGILAAIVVPGFFKYQAEINSQKMKADLVQAGIIIEQEQIDNNGLFPKYIPNEMLASPTMKEFSYTFSEDRTKFCLQANTPSGKWFISSESKTASNIVCTQSNVGENSSTPWKGLTVATPTFKGTPANTWASNASSSSTALSWNSIVCDLDDADAAEWADKTVATYSIKAINITRGGTLTLPWQTQTTANMKLTGWLPGDKVTYQVQARCTITSGTEYTYTSGFSGAVPDTVALFEVDDTSFTSTPTMLWGVTDTAPSYSASWKDAFCPAGTMQYRINVTQTGATTDATGNTAWATSRTKALNSTFSGGKGATLTHYVSCLLPDGRRIDSAGLTAQLNVPLKPPVAPASIGSNNANGLTAIVPNNIFWSATTCVLGSPEYRLNRTAPSAVNSAWVSANNLEQSLTAGTDYTYRVEARCANGSAFSDVSGYSPSTTFTAQYSIPPQPAVPAGLRSDAGGTSNIENNRLLWSAVACDDSAYAEYRVQRYMKNGVTSGQQAGPSPWQQGLNYALPDSWLAWGSTLGFQVQSRCTNVNFSSEPTAWSAGHTFTTSVPTPAAPGGVRNDGGGSGLWNAVSCAPGTSAEYRLNLTTSNGNSTPNNYGGWTSALRWDFSWNQGTPQAARIQARCSGPNVDSAISAFSATTSWTTVLYAPSGMNAGIPSFRTASWGGNCAPGASIQFVWAIRDTREVDKWSNYNWSGQTSYSNQSVAWGSGSVNVTGRCVTSWATSDGAGARGNFG